MSQLVGLSCIQCLKTISSIVEGEFCHECGKPVHKACKRVEPANPSACPKCGSAAPSTVAHDDPGIGHRDASPTSGSHLPPMNLHVNRFSLKLLVGGMSGCAMGIWWFLDGLSDGYMNGIIGGLIWKGPILAVTGAAAVYYGYRIMSDPD